jgi:hypothetical protein
MGKTKSGVNKHPKYAPARAIPDILNFILKKLEQKNYPVICFHPVIFKLPVRF